MLQYHDFTHRQPLKLENGEFLPEVTLAYSTYGKLNDDKSNVIWVCHAFTGNANPSDWWNGLIGENRHFNPEQYFVVCMNVPGSHYGSTNPLSVNPETGQPYFHTFPMLTIRDVVNCLEILRQHLEIDKIHTLMGGSLGGQQAVEWAVSNPGLHERLILFSTNAVHSPWGIAFNESQRMAIENDPSWQNNDAKAGMEGMKVARSIALLSYRNYQTYNRTQSRDEGQIDFFRANTYQNYQGEKIQRRFNAFSYWVLSKMFDSHDVGRERGGIEKALAGVKAKTLVIGITSDMLFPPQEQALIASCIPDAQYVEIDSDYGHDGFLIEFEEMTQAITSWEKQNA
ncbi:homoserine O-acetyltransferase family protein [Jiulongibacter sediminis]|jgi:homoserine O-acetyltransferase|uniref:Homoserine O-acetyltransferase n=1 Tax=Jiulongibacter sediminis TaxID=1605367 RepID=A0A0P7BNN4_9BACT|nr:homoserine O-acetyltransferase [Jiulongibacter sediminis]KPM46899.1 homoserine acetyltransferase [Jiulongibacter sediminis]TBX22248.1 homoserine acetyltransferase [Jiulongibacter sediminis]